MTLLFAIINLSYDDIGSNYLNIKDGFTYTSAILIPTPKSDWDCITVTIDRKIPEQECKNLINHLVRQKMANIENENFRNAIIEYLNNKN